MCLTNLSCFEDVTGKIDKGKLLDVVCLDFQNIFDNAHVKGLHVKLRHLAFEAMY